MIVNILLTVLFIWLLWMAVKLFFKLTWGAVKIIALVLLILSLPTLAGCLLAGGLLLLVPVGLILLVVLLVKLCK